MLVTQRKSDFSTRLKRLLKKNFPSIQGATDLARFFNLQYRSVSHMGISVQTAHKWLNNRAIPNTGQMKALTEWLGVSPLFLQFDPSSDKMEAVETEIVN